MQAQDMNIKLNFINRSDEANDPDIVIFAMPVEPDSRDLAVAWQVIRHCGRGDSHPFVFPEATDVGCSDSDGNFTPRLPAATGQRFTMTLAPSGHELVASGQGSSPIQVQVLNGLQSGAINAHIYKAGKLFLRKTAIAPEELAAFQFKPTIWIGAVSQVEEGQPLNSAVTSSVDAELSLLGIASADIVMTGGGPGPKAPPLKFTLDNVVMA